MFEAEAKERQGKRTDLIEKSNLIDRVKRHFGCSACSIPQNEFSEDDRLWCSKTNSSFDPLDITWMGCNGEAWNFDGDDSLFDELDEPKDIVANLPPSQPRKARDDAAKAVNVSPRSVESASKVLKQGTEVMQLITTNR